MVLKGYLEDRLVRAELSRLWGAQIAENETVDCDCLNGRNVSLEKGFLKRDYFRGRVEFFYGHEILFFKVNNVLHNQSNKKNIKVFYLNRINPYFSIILKIIACFLLFELELMFSLRGI